MPKTDITYTKVGDYLIPDLILPPEDDNIPIGIWGKRHYEYLKNHRKALYSIMVMDNICGGYFRYENRTYNHSRGQ